MANFLYALTLYNYKKNKNKILKSINYIVSKQDDQGFFTSRWYYGIYYGTYVCVRLFCSVSIQEYEKSIYKAINFIIKEQNSDGGWGYLNESDSLSTSFAILTLNYFKEKFKDVINLGILYLRRNQNETGGWEAVNFIKPKAYEPYKSEIITTAYALKAITSN